MIPKPSRVLAPEFLRFIRSKPCVVCGHATVDADHLHTRGAGGSDFSALPLCRLHHSERHQLGNARFEEKYRINLWRINATLVVEFFTSRAA